MHETSSDAATSDATARSTRRQTISYLAVGGGGWCVNVAVFWLLDRMGTPYAAAAVASYLGSNVLMWQGNRRFTFGPSDDSLLREYLRYLVVGVSTTLAANVLLLALLVDVVGIAPLPAQVIALSAAVPVSFLAFKHWAFAGHSR